MSYRDSETKENMRPRKGNMRGAIGRVERLNKQS